MHVNIQTGKLVGASWRPSPNFDARPPGEKIDLLVIHGISLPPGEFGGPWIEALFNNRLAGNEHPYFASICHLKVSAHLLVRRNGQLLQFVPLHSRAWHAGRSSFCGRQACNDYSIGIELEGTDEIPYEPIQYQVLATVAATLIQAYPGITPDRIVGHCDIAAGRKSDPGQAFDWEYWRRKLARAMKSELKSGSTCSTSRS